MDNTTIKNWGGLLGDLAKAGGNPYDNMTNIQIANSGPGAAADFMKQSGQKSMLVGGTPTTAMTHSVASTGWNATVSGNTSAVTFSKVGTFPTGINLGSANGFVNGTPAANTAGTYASLSIKAVDGQGHEAHHTLFTVVVA
jgi:hypothetical protein